jgi:serine/threonine protein kinase
LIVRSGDGSSSTGTDLSADTAVASRQSMAAAARAETPLAGMPALVEMVGATLSGRYLVTRKIGQGGMGAVYEATHTLIGKRVAVKVLLEKYARREAIVARLKKEAQLASSVQNEHIIDVTDFGQTDDGRTFVVMEFLEGESLAECLARETRLPEQRVLRIAQQAASALAAAHASGIVHRDIKPENLFLLRRKEQDFVKVVDFGISKSLRASGEEDAPRLTQTGMVLGTPLYMSPEQARGDDELDHRVDIYALGVIMYEAATGRVPFIGNNYLSVISQVLNEECKHPREIVPELSEEFEAIVMRAMSKDKHDRYGDAQEMLADIATVIEDPTHSTERAKITGPRRKMPKKGSLKVAVWAGSIALIVIALLMLVNFTMGGPSGKKPPAVAPVDAAIAGADATAVVPTAVDAQLEQVKMVSLRIVTVPPGATIIKDGVPQSDVTPASVDVVDKEKDVKFILQLDGYNDHEFSVNPKEKLPKDNKFTFTLKKPAKGEPIRQAPRVPPAGAGGSGSGASAGSAARPTDSTASELGGNPLRSGAPPPPKK